MSGTCSTERFATQDANAQETLNMLETNSGSNSSRYESKRACFCSISAFYRIGFKGRVL